MIDFHSHILPRMDDGSANIDESLALLGMLRGQGAECVIATPHFYANHESTREFLSRRSAAYDALSPHLSEDLPRVLLGAEVRYYEGIGRMSDLRSLCIEGTRLLLLEMPMGHWTEYMVQELIDISCRAGVILILAHVERYYDAQSRGVWDRLLEADILMQVNASFFIRFGQRRRAIRLLKQNAIHLIGSDCHNLSDRKPQMREAFDYIEKRMGADFTHQMNAYTADLLGLGH